MSEPSKLFKHLAQRAQQSSLTPEQIAADNRRDGVDRRTNVLSVARPAIRPDDVRAIANGTLKPNPWLARVDRWLAGSTSIMILIGSIGSGKSVAACWAMAERGGNFVSAHDLARISTDFKRDLWQTLVSAHVLVVDDLGDEQDPAKLSPALKILISQRSSHNGRTIITSNLTREDLKLRYPDEKLWSRVAQSSAFCSMNGPDLRREPPL